MRENEKKDNARLLTAGFFVKHSRRALMCETHLYILPLSLLNVPRARKLFISSRLRYKGVRANPGLVYANKALVSKLGCKSGVHR